MTEGRRSFDAVAFGLALVPRALLVEAVLEVLTVLLIVARRFIFDPEAYFAVELIVTALFLSVWSLLRRLCPPESRIPQNAPGKGWRSRLPSGVRPSSLFYSISTANVLGLGSLMYVIGWWNETAGGPDSETLYPKSPLMATFHGLPALWLLMLFVLLSSARAAVFISRMRPPHS